MRLKKRLEKILTERGDSVIIQKPEIETINAAFKRFAMKVADMQVEDMEESEISIAEILVRFGYLEEDVETTWEDGVQYNWRQFIVKK